MNEADIQLLHKSNYELLKVVNFLDSAPEPPNPFFYASYSWLKKYRRWHQTKEKVMEDLENAFKK